MCLYIAWAAARHRAEQALHITGSVSELLIALLIGVEHKSGRGSCCRIISKVL